MVRVIRSLAWTWSESSNDDIEVLESKDLFETGRSRESILNAAGLGNEGILIGNLFIWHKIQ